MVLHEELGKTLFHNSKEFTNNVFDSNQVHWFEDELNRCK